MPYRDLCVIAEGIVKRAVDVAKLTEKEERPRWSTTPRTPTVCETLTAFYREVERDADKVQVFFHPLHDGFMVRLRYFSEVLEFMLEGEVVALAMARPYTAVDTLLARLEEAKRKAGL